MSAHPRKVARPTRSPTQARGHSGEQVAASYLELLGFRIRKRNWRCRSGEIDLICEEGDCLVFTEVKLRASLEHGQPAEAVTYGKQARIIRAAALYAVTHGLEERTMRFDIVEVVVTPASGPRCRLMRSAFTPQGYSVL